MDWIVEPFLPDSARIQFLSNRPIGSRLECSSVSAVNCADLDFVASLTNLTNLTTVPGSPVADMTSTLTFTAAVRLNGTVVQCRGTTADGIPMTNITLNVAGTSTLQHFFSCLLTVLLLELTMSYSVYHSLYLEHCIHNIVTVKECAVLLYSCKLSLHQLCYAILLSYTSS